MVDGDGPPICMTCLYAWGHYSATILRGSVVREAGGIQLRHAGHAAPMFGCPMCRADRVRSALSFDGWMRGRGA